MALLEFFTSVGDQEHYRPSREGAWRSCSRWSDHGQPCKAPAKRSLHRNAFRVQPAEDAAPRAHAIPDLQKLNQLASVCSDVHHSYSDFVMLTALLAARSSEVSGLQVGDVDFTKNLVIIRRQVFPGSGGLITKRAKSRKDRRVPSLDPHRPVLKRLSAFKQSDALLLVGPRGVFLTTATVRDAGVPLHVLQEIIGHASIEITRGYLHPDDRHLASAAEQANAFLRHSA